MTWENMINWSKKIKKHDIKLTGVFGIEEYTYESFYASIKDLANSEITSLNIGTSDMTVGGGGSEQWSQDRTTYMRVIKKICYSLLRFRQPMELTLGRQ